MFFLADHSCGGPRLLSYRKITIRLDPWILNIKLTKTPWRTCKAGAAWWGFLSTLPCPLFFSSESPALSSAFEFSPPENAQLPKKGGQRAVIRQSTEGNAGTSFQRCSKSTVCLPCGDLHPPASACRSVWVSPPNRSSPAPVSESPPSEVSPGPSAPGTALWLSPGHQPLPLFSSAGPPKWAHI